MKATTKYQLALALALATPFAAQALTIGFESGEGYSAGNLEGQPTSGTQWTRTNAPAAANVINVASGAGVGGSNGIVGVGTGGGSNFVYYGFNTTNADLGFTFNSSSSVLQYSFDWRPTQDLDGTSASAIFAFMIGSDQNAGGSGAAQVTVRNNGVFVAQNGGAALTQAGLFTTNTFATISGTIDYGANTYTVFVNGVQQFTGTNGGNLAFVNADSDNAFIRIGNLSGGSADHRTWGLDNITVIPEPSTLALLGIAAGALAMFRRRK